MTVLRQIGQLDDEALLRQFESCTLPTDDFGHRDHIRLAWVYLQRFPLAEVLERFPRHLQQFAAHLGAADLYHATITWAYLIAIHERMAQGSQEDWSRFAERNPDLFTPHTSFLSRYYRGDTLASELARKTFLLPDRLEAV